MNSYSSRFPTQCGHVCRGALRVGSHRARSPPAAGNFIAQQIRGARCVELDAAHISNVQAADRFTESVLGYVGN